MGKRAGERRQTPEIKKPPLETREGWFDTGVWSGCPPHRTFEPLLLRLRYVLDGMIRLATASIISEAGGGA